MNIIKRLSYALATLSITSLPNAADAADIYMEGFGGLTSLSDYTLDDSSNQFADATVESSFGWNFGGAVGAKFPLGIVDLRVEGEIAFRNNDADNVNVIGVNGSAVDEANTFALSGMANAHADYYVLSNLAITAGGGLGYARVTSDIAADFNGAGGLNVVGFADNQSDGVFAYQLMTGVRYDITSNSTISLGYRYFATTNPSADVFQGNGATFEYEYATHNFNVGIAYGF